MHDGWNYKEKTCIRPITSYLLMWSYKHDLNRYFCFFQVRDGSSNAQLLETASYKGTHIMYTNL
jgi:hypothetical protein